MQSALQEYAAVPTERDRLAYGKGELKASMAELADEKVATVAKCDRLAVENDEPKAKVARVTTTYKALKKTVRELRTQLLAARQQPPVQECLTPLKRKATPVSQAETASKRVATTPAPQGQENEASLGRLLEVCQRTHSSDYKGPLLLARFLSSYVHS